MKLSRVNGPGTPWRVEYEAPPVPAIPEQPEGTAAIAIPEEEGTPVTVFTHENGMTTYLHREAHHWGAAAEYAGMVETWMSNHPAAQLLGLPNSQHPAEPVWVPRYTLERMMHLHDAVVRSPLATERVGGLGGKTIYVPMGDGVAEIAAHGPGKRRRR